MMFDTEFLLIAGAFALLGSPILGIIAFFSVRGLKKKVASLQAQVNYLQAGMPSVHPQNPDHTTSDLEPHPIPDPTSEQTAEMAASDAVDDVASDNMTADIPNDNWSKVAETEEAEEAEEAAAAEPTRNTSKSPRPNVDTESTIGGKLSIWIGGLTLAIGGLYLVKYSIDAGLLGPQARVILGVIFGLSVTYAGEWTRRRPDRFALTGFESANIPAILSGTGIFILFGAVFSAHSLYGLIGPVLSFILLASLALGALFISLLHGPILAALGLLSSYIVPFLITSDSANIAVLSAYVLLVSASAMYVAWYRSWLWCALLSVGAMFIYAVLLESDEGRNNSIIVGLYVLGTIILTYISLVWSVHERKPDADIDIDWIPTIALSVLFLPIFYHFYRDQSLAVHIMELGLLLVLPLAAIYRYPALRFVTIVPACLAVLKYTTMYAPAHYRFEEYLKLENQSMGSQWTLYPTQSITPYLSDATYMTIGAIVILALISFAILTAPKARARLVTACVSASVSLAIFSACYIRLNALEPSIEFALIGLLLFAIFHFQANYYHRTLDEGTPARDGTIAVALIASLVALSLAISIYFSGIGLTISLGLITAVSMITHMRYPLLGVRIFAAIAVVPYALRLVWEPFIDKSGLADAAPFFNQLTLGYGIPAIGFIFASYMATRYRRDVWAQILQAAAIISSLITITMLALHAIDPRFAFISYQSALAAAATLVMVGGAFSLGLTRLNRAQRIDDVLADDEQVDDELEAFDAAIKPKLNILQIAADGLGILGMIIGAFSLFIVLNPVMLHVSRQFGQANVHMGEGLLFNLIGYSYALPFILFALITWQGRATKSQIYQWAALSFSALLAIFWINLSIRHAFHGDNIANAPILQAENYTYSLVWLGIGILVLYLGVRWREQVLRKISGGIILLVVLKAFLIDMSHLEGVLRAISFIGLGGTLMGIGFVYQRALRGMFAQTDDAVSDMDGSQDIQSDDPDNGKPS